LAILKLGDSCSVNASEIASAESWEHWKSNSPSDGCVDFIGTKIILKNGRKVYTKMPYNEVLEIWSAWIIKYG